MSTDAATGGQPLLFDSLPETESSARRRPRRARTTPAPASVERVADRVWEPAPLPRPSLPPLPPASPVAVPVVAPALDPAALTNPELRALVRGLSDLRLSYLVVEVARELKQRVQPDVDEDGVVAEPNPSLLRAARLAVGELSGEDD